MVPSRFVQLDHLPLTVNGKVDKDALAELESSDMRSDVVYVAPLNEAEERIVSIWQDVLGVKKIGLRDNFFNLGGHSLKAGRVITLVNNAFNVKLDVQALFLNPTIEDFVAAVLNAGRLADKSNPNEAVNASGKKRT